MLTSLPFRVCVEDRQYTVIQHLVLFGYRVSFAREPVYSDSYVLQFVSAEDEFGDEELNQERISSILNEQAKPCEWIYFTKSKAIVQKIMNSKIECGIALDE